MKRQPGLSSSKKKSGLKEQGGATVKENVVFPSIFNSCSEKEVNREKEVQTAHMKKSGGRSKKKQKLPRQTMLERKLEV